MSLSDIGEDWGGHLTDGMGYAKILERWISRATASSPKRHRLKSRKVIYIKTPKVEKIT